MDPRTLSKSSKSLKIMPNIKKKKSHTKNPYNGGKTLSGGQNHVKTVKNRVSEV